VSASTSVHTEKDERFLFHVWPDGCAVFDRSCGDTHILDVVSALGFLSGLQATTSEIVKLQLPDVPLDELSSALDDARLRLEKIELPFALPS
jgi:hypothetical protein